jgi:hypothetical protein
MTGQGLENHALRKIHRPRAIENKATRVGFLFEKEKLK